MEEIIEDSDKEEDDETGESMSLIAIKQIDSYKECYRDLPLSNIAKTEQIWKFPLIWSPSTQNNVCILKLPP